MHLTCAWVFNEIEDKSLFRQRVDGGAAAKASMRKIYIYIFNIKAYKPILVETQNKSMSLRVSIIWSPFIVIGLLSIDQIAIQYLTFYANNMPSTPILSASSLQTGKQPTHQFISHH